MGDAVDGCAVALQGLWGRLKWTGRVLRNVLTGAEVSKRYPDKLAALLWNRLPSTVRSWKVTTVVGRHIHRRACKFQPRSGSDGTANFTRFFRNMPQLELLRDLTLDVRAGVPLRLAVLGCSTGAELYSAVWVIRTARPEQEIQALGIDVSESTIHTAANGIYPLRSPEIVGMSESKLRKPFYPGRRQSARTEMAKRGDHVVGWRRLFFRP